MHATNATSWMCWRSCSVASVDEAFVAGGVVAVAGGGAEALVEDVRVRALAAAADEEDDDGCELPHAAKAPAIASPSSSAIGARPPRL
jgi:hypothetical protein